MAWIKQKLCFSVWTVGDDEETPLWQKLICNGVESSNITSHYLQSESLNIFSLQ